LRQVGHCRVPASLSQSSPIHFRMARELDVMVTHKLVNTATHRTVDVYSGDVEMLLLCVVGDGGAKLPAI
jgi:hypothetical protein